MTHPQPVEAEAVAWRYREWGAPLWSYRSEPRSFPNPNDDIEPLFPLSSLTSRDERIAALEALLEEAVKGLEEINEIGVEAKRHPPADDFDRGARAARAETSDIASQTLSTIRACEELEG